MRRGHGRAHRTLTRACKNDSPLLVEQMSDRQCSPRRKHARLCQHVRKALNPTTSRSSSITNLILQQRWARSPCIPSCMCVARHKNELRANSNIIAHPVPRKLPPDQIEKTSGTDRSLWCLTSATVIPSGA
eukprot:806281-Amphidinium_carterae.1